MKSYDDMSDNNKKDIILSEYTNKKLSFAEIAKLYGTYSNKIRRDAIRFGISIRSKSDAQKTALVSGRHSHPTKGKPRTEQTKSKIGMSVLNSWETMSEEELERRKQIARNNWDKLSDDEKQSILQSANNAVRDAGKHGSKLELYMMNELLKDGYRVEFHKEQVLLNTKLQIDLFLPTINTAIEIDGPSHFQPVWGEQTLEKNQKYDNKKTGLILGKGMVLIRVKQTKDFSRSRAKKLYSDLKLIIENISNKFPDSDKRYIEIGE